MSELHEAEAVFRQVMAATFERRDVDAAVELFAEDAVLVDYSDCGTVHSGRAAIAELVRSFFELIPDAEHEVTDLIATGDRVAAAVMIRGTRSGEQEPTELSLCVFDVVQGGKILSEHLYGGGTHPIIAVP